MASEFNGGYFKKYAREQRIQTTEENFTKGIKFEQTPLESGEHKYIVNYDMLLSKVMLHINWNKYCIWVHCRIYMFDNNPNYNKSKRMAITLMQKRNK